MATHQLTQVLQSLRDAALPPQEAGLTDGQLLDSYLRTRQESALAALAPSSLSNRFAVEPHRTRLAAASPSRSSQ